MNDVLAMYGEATKASVGFFWKAGWAFVMGYAVSAMIQSFVPKKRLSPYLGGSDPRSIALAAGFGAASSSCSFAALAAARALVAKGAHFVAAVAFMFASTNLVIELGVLILIFLGWQYLLAEVVGGLLLITVSSLLIKATYPREWLESAREKAEEEAPDEEGDFDPWQRMKSLEGWRRVGKSFVMEWQMVWQEILLGFTIAGFMKVFVPTEFWQTVFLIDQVGSAPDLLIALQNALVAPFVAATTFIGSMGNIPLAAVLAGSGITFAGLMGFIYSDLMVPPLVKVNAEYYGWKVALYIAGVMYVSIVVTAVTLHLGFGALGLLPEAGGATEASHGVFRIDYTFFLNLVFAAVAGLLVWLWRSGRADGHGGHDHGDHDHGDGEGVGFQGWVTRITLAVVAVGIGCWIFA